MDSCCAIGPQRQGHRGGAGETAVRVGKGSNEQGCCPSIEECTSTARCREKTNHDAGRRLLHHPASAWHGTDINFTCSLGSLESNVTTVDLVSATPGIIRYSPL